MKMKISKVFKGNFIYIVLEEWVSSNLPEPPDQLAACVVYL